MNKRIEWIDIAKGIGMLLVIFGHFGMNPAGKEAITFVKSSFHMPLFFVLSGLLFKGGSSAKDCFTWSMKRFIVLMIPFYLWTAIYSNGSYKGFAGIIYASNKTLSGAGTNAAMWFIPCMCIAGILVKFEVYFIDKLKLNKYINYAILATVNFGVGGGIPQNLIQEYGWPMSFNIAFTGAGFILVGALLGGLLAEVRKSKTGHVVVLLITTMVLTILFAELNTSAREIETFGTAVMAWAEYGNYPLFLLSGIFGSVFVMLLSMLLEKASWLKDGLCRIGKNTMIILAIHFTVMKLFEILGNHFAVLNNLVYLIVAVIATTVICSWIAELISKLVPSLSKGKWPREV